MQSLGNRSAFGVELGDLDGDGDLDAFVVNKGQANRVWLNDGAGFFSTPGQELGNGESIGVDLGDLDGDGDLDAYVANYGPDIVWINDGTGHFSGSGQFFANWNSTGVELGDLDGDGDLDAFTSVLFQKNRYWLNQGTCLFTLGGETIRNWETQNPALGDLDGDGDLDVFFSSWNKAEKVFLNDCSPSDPFTDIRITKTSNPESLHIGSNILYTISVKNLSPNAAANLVVTDTLPAGVVFDAALSHPGCAATGSVVRCPLGHLPGSATVQITIGVAVQPGVGAGLTNHVHAVIENTDTNLNNNTA
ncbi:MAG: DUF11 domain-containing protein, partial [Verrucomicrobiota bacterium]